MATPNAGKGRDPAAPNSRMDRRFSPDASRDEAMVDIPMAPATIANMKKADPYCTIGSGNDHAGLLDDAVEEGNSGY